MTIQQVVSKFLALQGRIIEVDGVKLRLSRACFDHSVGYGKLELEFELAEKITAITLTIETEDVIVHALPEDAK